MKKLMLLAILLLNFLVLPNASADNRVVIDRLSQSEAEDLDITIPDDVPPGWHSITIEVYDDKGTVSQKEISFCKDENGVVQWDNNCPNLVLDTSSSSDVPQFLVPYDPVKDPNTTSDLQLGALAALVALASAKKDEEPKEDDEQESIESVEHGDLKLLKDEPGRGDTSRTWDNRFTDSTDYAVVYLAKKFNGHSPLLTRTVQDGNTLRAMFGSWGFLLMPIGFVLGLLASLDTNFTALPPKWTLVAAIVAVAVFDSFAGFLAGFTFFILALVTGNISTRPELLTTIGLMILFFAPALLASSFRPFRRLVRSGDDLWERITDYALGTLLTFWVITVMVGSMNGLARLELRITDHATALGLVSALLLVGRMALEDIAVEHYPMRLRALYVEIEEPTHRQKLRALMFKTVIFMLLAAPFVPSVVTLILGTIIFVIPLVTGLALEDNFKKRKLNLPSGVLKTVSLIFVMAIISKWIEGLFDTPASFLKWNFVVMALPGFVLHYLDAITDEPNSAWKTHKNGRYLYRIGGVFIFGVMVLIVKDVDIAAWLVG